MKAARLSPLVERIISTDMFPLSVGLYEADKGFILPSAREEASYVEKLHNICKKEHIQSILVGSEPEIRVLVAHVDRFRAEGTEIIVSSKEVIQTALDKLTTCHFLESNGLNFPKYAELDRWETVEELLCHTRLPVIVKPRRGSGSQGLYTIESMERLRSLANLQKECVVQELLGSKDEEYTVGIFVPKNGEPLDPIILKRDLAAGLTYRAEVVQNEVIANEAKRVARALQPNGPCNLQMRLTERGAVTFEINPRFSSTTSMRAHFRYNEVDLALRNFVLGEAVTTPDVVRGYAMRYWEEMYTDEMREFCET